MEKDKDGSSIHNVFRADITLLLSSGLSGRTEFLVAEGAIHAVRLKQKSKTKRKKKIATAIYEYQADCDGEWGEISLDFENGTAEIIRLADWDTMKTNRFANKAIVYLLNCENEKLPKETIVAAEL